MGGLLPLSASARILTEFGKADIHFDLKTDVKFLDASINQFKLLDQMAVHIMGTCMLSLLRRLTLTIRHQQPRSAIYVSPQILTDGLNRNRGGWTVFWE